MRPVLHGDVVAAARVLLGVPRAERRRVMRQMLQQASFADQYYKRLKRGHPTWGNGSLMAAAGTREMAPEPFLDDPTYCRCLVVVFEELIRWRSERAAFNRPRKASNLHDRGFHLGVSCLSVIKQGRPQGTQDDKHAHEIGRSGPSLGSYLR